MASDNLVERYQKLVKDSEALSNAVVSGQATLVEKQKRLRENLDAIKNEFGIEPSNVESEIAKMEIEINSEMEEITALLKQVNDTTIMGRPQ